MHRGGRRAQRVVQFLEPVSSDFVGGGRLFQLLLFLGNPAPVPQFLLVGELLLKLKGAVPHGGFKSALERAGIPYRTAARLMQIARAGMAAEALADSGIRGAAEALASRKGATVAPLEGAGAASRPPKPKESYFKQRYRTDPAFRAKRAEYNRAERQRRKLRQAKEGAPL